MNSTAEPLDFSKTLNRGIEILKLGLVPFSMMSIAVGLAMGVALALILGVIITPLAGGTTTIGGVIMLFALYAILAVPVTLVISLLGSAGVIAIVDETATSGSSTVETGLSAAQEHAGPVIKTAIPLILVGMGLALLAWIPVIGWFGVPVVGAYLYTRWSLAMIVTVIEGETGNDALNRSKELVGTNFWTMLGLLVVIGICSAIAYTVLGLVLGVIPYLGAILASALSMVISMSLIAFLYAAYETLSGKGQVNAPRVAAAMPGAMPAAPATPDDPYAGGYTQGSEDLTGQVGRDPVSDSDLPSPPS